MRIVTGMDGTMRTLQILNANPGQILRVPPLEVQRLVEVHRQRPDRVAAIDEYLRTRGAD